MRPATPRVTLLFAGVTLKTRFVGLRRRLPGRIEDVLGFQGFNVFCTVAMAALARGGARILQEFGAFAVNVQGEGLHNLLVALLALRSDYGPLNRPLGARLLSFGAGALRKGMEKADKGYNNQ
jgi:hypothetical protein